MPISHFLYRPTGSFPVSAPPPCATALPEGGLAVLSVPFPVSLWLFLPVSLSLFPACVGRATDRGTRPLPSCCLCPYTLGGWVFWRQIGGCIGRVGPTCFILAFSVGPLRFGRCHPSILPLGKKVRIGPFYGFAPHYLTVIHRIDRRRKGRPAPRVPQRGGK